MEAPKLTTFEESCIELVAQTRTSCRGGQSVLNAVRHLQKGWEIREIDKEMAVFRVITAEEEAATGLFYAFQYRHYKHSDRLNPWNHAQKNAAVLFLHLLSMFFNKFPELKDTKKVLHIQEHNGEKRLMLGIPMSVHGTTRIAYPEPPLNFTITAQSGVQYFEDEIDMFLASIDENNILTFIRNQANLRNDVLYASPKGRPSVEALPETLFAIRKKRIMALTFAYLLVIPWREHQSFAQHGLDAFLLMLKKLKLDELQPDA